MKNRRNSVYLLFILLAIPGIGLFAKPPEHSKWTLVFEDDFSGPSTQLDENWEFQNGPSGHILCSRWRENASVDDGILKLTAKKESRGGQDWTAASMWTKKKFKYGYFECRYRYLPTTGANNSFWIMTRDKVQTKFEIDINEGHYPNEVNMNLHNWSGEHWAKSARWNFTNELGTANENLATHFHNYALEWNPKELIYYFDGKQIRIQENTICHGEAPVWLSLAIMKWAGPVQDELNGKSMDIDYVKIYQVKQEQ